MMTRRQANIGLLSAATIAATGAAAAGPETKIIQLPPARTAGGKPLMEALKLRHSTREFCERQGL